MKQPRTTLIVLAAAILAALSTISFEVRDASAQSAGSSQAPVAPAASPAVLPPQPIANAKNQSVTLADVRGEVLVRAAGSAEWRAARQGDRLSPGDTVKTGEKGAAAVVFDNRARIDLTPSSEITIQEAVKSGQEKTTLVRLDLGRLKASVDQLKGESQFKIQTPTAVASVRGTILFVNVGAVGSEMTTDLYVDKGLVDFAPIGDLLNGALVDQFGLSSILGDGTLLDVRHLSQDERRQFLEVFDQAIQNAGNPQGEVEEGGEGEGEGEGEGDEGEDDTDLSDVEEDQGRRNSFLDDGANARLNRALIALRLVQSRLFAAFGHEAEDEALEEAEDAQLLSEGVEDSGDWEFSNVSGENADQGIVTSGREEPLADLLGAAEDTSDNVETIDDNVDQLEELLDAALSTNDNAAFVPPANAAGEESADAYDEIEEAAEIIADRSDALKDLRQQEREAMRDILNDILADQEFLLRQAQIEQQNDQKTGKVFTDVHGNRVRTDQYIFQPDGRTVQLVSLTLRTGDYQKGISSLIFSVEFNRDIEDLGDDVTFRNLPWSDYLNVVTREEMAAALGIDPDDDWEQYEELAEQYIVHESNGLAGTGEESFHPETFTLEMRNPQGDREMSDSIRFEEQYGWPQELSFQDHDQGGGNGDDDDHGGPGDGGSADFIAQALEYEHMIIASAAGHTLEIETEWCGGSADKYIREDGGEWDYFYNWYFDSDDQPQSDDFTDEEYSELVKNLWMDGGINAFRHLAVNQDEDPENDVYPAHFEDEFSWRYGDDEEYLGVNTLIGLFIPIGNDGIPLGDDGEPGFGFDVQGLRDVLVPNPHVNGGNYNLEMIFAYGYVDDDDDFVEDFRIDVIVTPELLTHHGLKVDSEYFPQQLQPFGENGDDCDGECGPR